MSEDSSSSQCRSLCACGPLFNATPPWPLFLSSSPPNSSSITTVDPKSITIGNRVPEKMITPKSNKCKIKTPGSSSSSFLLSNESTPSSNKNHNYICSLLSGDDNSHLGLKENNKHNPKKAFRSQKLHAYVSANRIYYSSNSASQESTLFFNRHPHFHSHNHYCNTHNVVLYHQSLCISKQHLENIVERGDLGDCNKENHNHAQGSNKFKSKSKNSENKGECTPRVLLSHDVSADDKKTNEKTLNSVFRQNVLDSILFSSRIGAISGPTGNGGSQGIISPIIKKGQVDQTLDDFDERSNFGDDKKSAINTKKRTKRKLSDYLINTIFDEYDEKIKIKLKEENLKNQHNYYSHASSNRICDSSFQEAFSSNDTGGITETKGKLSHDIDSEEDITVSAPQSQHIFCSDDGDNLNIKRKLKKGKIQKKSIESFTLSVSPPLVPMGVFLKDTPGSTAVKLLNSGVTSKKKENSNNMFLLGSLSSHENTNRTTDNTISNQSQKVIQIAEHTTSTATHYLTNTSAYLNENLFGADSNAQHIIPATGNNSDYQKVAATENNGNRKNNFPCEFCHKTFKQRSQWKRHVDCIHLKICKFFCPHCSKPFKRSDHLKNHIRRIHPEIVL